MSEEQAPDPASPQPEGEEDGGWQSSMAVPIVIVALAIGLIAVIIFVSRQEQDAGQEALAAATVTTDALPVTVPYRELAGRIVIDVTLGDGSPTVPMIVDSGGPTIVSEEVAEVFGSGPAGSVSTRSTNDELFSNEVVTLPRLAIGEAVFRDVGAVVGSLRPGDPSYCLTDAGSIGASLMQTGAWHIDPVDATITIADGVQDLSVAADALRFDFTRASPVSPTPLIELALGADPYPVLLDSGWDGWLALSPLDLESAGIGLDVDAPAAASLATTPDGTRALSTAWSATDIDLGTPARIPVAVIDTLPAGVGIAGTDLLRHFAVTLDWKEDVAYLEPRGDGAAPSLPANVGVGWDDGFVVGSLLLGGPGSDAVELGAPIRRLDGRDVRRAPFDDFCGHLLNGPTEFQLTLDDEASTTIAAAPVEGFFDALVSSTR